MSRSWGWRFLDFVLLPCLIVILAFEPNAAHGRVDYLESGQYLSVINEIFQGKILYRDTYLFFGPFSYYGPAFAMLLFGKTLAVLRQYFLLGDIVTYIVLYFLCRFVIRNRFLACLAAIVIVVQTHNPFWCSRWGGFRFVSAYAVILTLSLFIRSRSGKYAWLAGFFTGAAFLHGVDMGILSLIAAVALFVADKFLVSSAKEETLPSSFFYLL